MRASKLDELDNPQGPTFTEPGGDLLPDWANRFLTLLTQNGSVSMSARLVGKSRSWIYAFAHQAPSFRRAMDEAKLEFRDLLLGEAHKRAIHNQSDTILRALLGLYFPQSVDPSSGRARIDPTEITDEEIEQVARYQKKDELNLEALSDGELEQLENLLERAASGSTSRAG